MIPNIVDLHPHHRLSLERIARSAAAIPPEFLNSPQYDCEPLSDALGCQLTLKIEFANPIRSFKGRGASFLLSELARGGHSGTLVCASAGNWGQAMAYGCRAHGRPLTIYASIRASPMKVARMRALGAVVVNQGDDFDAAKAAAKAFARRTQATFVEDGAEPEISEGHGSLAVELLAHGAAFDDIVVPLGNGALLSGIARWFKAHSPSTRVLGVCAAGAPAMERSWRRGEIVETPQANTVADGIAVRVPVPAAVIDLQTLVDEVALVDDADISAAARAAWQHAGLLLEPAGAAGLAALLAHPQQFAGRRVVTVLCGSNVIDSRWMENLDAGPG